MFIVVYYCFSEYDFYDRDSSYEESEFKIQLLTNLDEVADFVVQHDQFAWKKEVIVFRSTDELENYLENGSNYEPDDEVTPNLFIDNSLASPLSELIKIKRREKEIRECQEEEKKQLARVNAEKQRRKTLYEELKLEFGE